MGNTGSRGSSNRRRRGSRRSDPPSTAPLPESAAANRYVVTTAPSPAGQYYHFPGYFPAPAPGPAMPVLPAPYDQHHRGGHVEGGDWVGGRYPPPPAAAPYVEHQKAVTIRNDVNLKKESLRVEADVDHPGKVLVCFTFDATVEGSISIIFFAKEGEECNLTPAKESQLPALTVRFQQGLGQKFRQASGTGIDLAAFEEAELLRAGDSEVYPLAVKAEALPEPANSQITLAVFEKDKGGFRLRVAKQILWVNGMRYELQEIYGIGNSVEADVDGNDPGKECVICLSEPRDTTVLPCRHMCMCSECAKVLRFQTNRCPICRQPVERLLEIRVNSDPEE